MANANIYKQWKPLRNFLRGINLYDALESIRAYSAYKTSGGATVEWPSTVEKDSRIDDRRYYLPWDLEILAREVLIVCEEKKTDKSLCKTRYLLTALDKIRYIDDAITEANINVGNIMRDITPRMAHRQFKYQLDKPNMPSFIRYAKIFSEPRVNKLLIDKIGIGVKKMVTLGLCILGKYMNQLYLPYPLKVQLPGVTEVDYDRFLATFSLPIASMEQKLRGRSLDGEFFFYEYNDMNTWPLIEVVRNGQRGHICPIPILLFWKITSGLYYLICDEKGFDNAFGEAFERYIGLVLEKSFDNNNVYVFKGERQTGKNPSTCDWVIDQPGTCLIIEVKTKRLSMRAKTTLRTNKYLDEQLSILAEAIKQAYLSLNAYKNGLYKSPGYHFSKHKESRVCVVTLEEWHIMGDSAKALKVKVKKMLKDEGLNPNFVECHPYVVIDAKGMEELAFLAKDNEVSELIDEYFHSREYSNWEFVQFVNNKHNPKLNGYQYVFGGTFEEIFDDDRGCTISYS